MRVLLLCTVVKEAPAPIDNSRDQSGTATTFDSSIRIGLSNFREDDTLLATQYFRRERINTASYSGDFILIQIAICC
jgi:hypothetical protein